MFEDLNEFFEKKLEFYNVQIEQTIGYMDQKIENDQMELFGITITYDLANTVLTLFLGAFGSIAQQELAT